KSLLPSSQDVLKWHKTITAAIQATSKAATPKSATSATSKVATSKAVTSATPKAATLATTTPTTILVIEELILNELTTPVSSPRRPETPIGEVVKTKRQSQIYNIEDIEGESE
ncbi:10503_t:CDS:1, partial [Ambispora leptoticha]